MSFRRRISNAGLRLKEFWRKTRKRLKNSKEKW
jgi:hypothetical protein